MSASGTVLMLKLWPINTYAQPCSILEMDEFHVTPLAGSLETTKPANRDSARTAIPESGDANSA